MENQITDKPAGDQRDSRRHIFIVEDDGAIGGMVAEHLKEQGFDTQAFKNAEAALSAFRGSTPRPVLLVTDYELPGMDGLELIEFCRKLEPGLKCIVASGVITRQHCIEAGVKPDAILKKPFFLKELVGLIDEVLKA